MLDVEAVCRCGTERQVKGSIVTCSHCDNPCAGFACARCRKLSLTCNDCRREHGSRSAAGKCEQAHYSR